MPDLETNDGVGWMIQDGFDFKHPVTDYDRICARHSRNGLLIVKRGKDSFVCISNGEDSLSWWPKVGVFTTNWPRSPSRMEVRGARFSPLGEISVPSGRILFMNPCLHGADPDLEKADDVIPIDIASGRYLVGYHIDPTSPVKLLVRLRPATRPRGRAQSRSR